MPRPVKIGYLLDFRNPPGSGRTFPELYAEMFRQVEFIDQAGFDSVWLPEHHFVDDGYISSVIPMLSAIAARTRRVTIGTFVLLMPFYHPLRLAEDCAVVDVISNGRLRLGIGKGYRGEEFDNFQIPRSERLGRTIEGIEILKRAWTGERFSFEGKYFRFHDVRVLPRPVSQPHPELLWGGMDPDAVRRGAEMDLSFACNKGGREIALYVETLKQLGKDPANYSIINSTGSGYIADSEQEAWDDVKGPTLYSLGLYGQWLSHAPRFDPKFIPLTPDHEALRRASMIGPPAAVAERLAKVIENNPLTTEFIIGMQAPGLDPAKVMRSLERFAAEVLPVLRR